MTFIYIQVCDRCSTRREIDKRTPSEVGGWRVFDDKHLCPDCVKELWSFLEKSTNNLEQNYIRLEKLADDLVSAWDREFHQNLVKSSVPTHITNLRLFLTEIKEKN